MSNSCALALFAGTLGGLGLSGLGGCASVPAFHPSVPVSGAKSLQEGLLLCNEYRAPAPAERPVALKPFVDCVNQIGERRFEGASQPFLVFNGELNLIYTALGDQSWNAIEGLELETAIHALLRTLSRAIPAADAGAGTVPGSGEEVYTPGEKEVVLRHFPLTARAVGAEHWPLTSQIGLDPALEALRAAVAALGTGPSAPPEFRSPSPLLESAELCQRYLKVQDDTDYVARLWRDQYEMTQLAPRTEASRIAREQYLKQLRAAQREVEALRPELESARSRGAFRAGSCQHR